MKEEKPEVYEFGDISRPSLVLAAVLAAVLIGFASRSVTAGLVTIFVYPIVGAVTVRIIEPYRAWAYRGSVDAFGLHERTLLAAVWPVSLAYSLIAHTVIGVFSRAIGSR